MPKLGKGGTLSSRQALLHSLVHIENWAIDLSWDIIARFGCNPDYQMPRDFFSDFVKVTRKAAYQQVAIGLAASDMYAAV
jgi:uncharacterized ferritin-like protein (DUF455 family)